MNAWEQREVVFERGTSAWRQSPIGSRHTHLLQFRSKKLQRFGLHHVVPHYLINLIRHDVARVEGTLVLREHWLQT